MLSQPIYSLVHPSFAAETSLSRSWADPYRLGDLFSARITFLPSFPHSITNILLFSGLHIAGCVGARIPDRGIKRISPGALKIPTLGTRNL